MKKYKYNIVIILGLFIGIWVLTSSKTTSPKKKNVVREIIKTNIDGKGTTLKIEVVGGKSFNHPTMAFWIEDTEGNYIQSLFVSQSVATGIFGHGEEQKYVWKHEPGEVRRPATLPYYLHKRNIKAPDGTYLPTPDKPIPDAYTGATPKADFQLLTKSDVKLSGKFILLFEVNQSWDWNEFWNNNLYPDDFNYKTSCQPALVYAVNGLLCAKSYRT